MPFLPRITMANKRYPKLKPISLTQQYYALRRYYPCLIDKIDIKSSKLTCVIRLQPSKNSTIYTVKIVYKLTDFSPRAWLISPELQKYDDEYPHHTFGQDSHGYYELCVYYPKFKEWNRQMFIADSYVPWICTWLNAYEYWLITGEWHYDEAFPRENAKKEWSKL